MLDQMLFQVFSGCPTQAFLAKTAKNKKISQNIINNFCEKWSFRTSQGRLNTQTK